MQLILPKRNQTNWRLLPSLSFPRKIIYSRLLFLSSIPPKAMKSNSESTAENQFLIKKKQSVGNRDVRPHRVDSCSQQSVHSHPGRSLLLTRPANTLKGHTRDPPCSRGQGQVLCIPLGWRGRICSSVFSTYLLCLAVEAWVTRHGDHAQTSPTWSSVWHLGTSLLHQRYRVPSSVQGVCNRVLTQRLPPPRNFLRWSLPLRPH